MTIASSAGSIGFMSCRLAPSTAKAMGMPSPSVNKLRLVPDLPLSVGLGPVPFSPQRGLVYRPIHGLPFPIQTYLQLP